MRPRRIGTFDLQRTKRWCFGRRRSVFPLPSASNGTSPHGDSAAVCHFRIEHQANPQADDPRNPIPFSLYEDRRLFLGTPNIGSPNKSRSRSAILNGPSSTDYAIPNVAQGLWMRHADIASRNFSTTPTGFASVPSTALGLFARALRNRYGGRIAVASNLVDCHLRPA